MEDFKKIIFDLDYSFEDDLVKRGFKLDCEKEEHTTYKKENLFIRIIHDAPNTDINGCPDLIRIFSTTGITGNNYYLGKSPANENHLDILLDNLYLESFK